MSNREYEPFRDESSFRIDDQKTFILRLSRHSGVEEVLQRYRSLQSAYDVHLAAFRSANPSGEFDRIGDGGAQHDDVNMGREQNEDLLPHDAALAVVDVVNLVKDDPLQIADDIRAVVQHRSQNFSRHDQTRSLGVDLNVARKQANISEGRLEISELLVRERFDGRCVNGSESQRGKNLTIFSILCTNWHSM